MSTEENWQPSAWKQEGPSTPGTQTGSEARLFSYYRFFLYAILNNYLTVSVLPKEAVNVIMKLRYIWAGPETAAGGDSVADISAYLFFCAFPLKRI